MNRSIRGVAVVVLLMFLALMANITIGYMTRTDELINDPRNSRVRDEQFGAERGPILVGNTPIVSNVATDTRPYAYQRTYLDGPLYAPITGYYSYLYGRSKLEQRYNAELTGQADSQFTQRIFETLSGKQPSGGVVQTTIRPQVQQAAWEALGRRTGAVVALDYTTGEIIAWVSSPSYDPSELSALDFDATAQSWNNLVNNPANPMSDRATQEAYPPGSTFKMVVAAAALANGYAPDTMIDTPAQMQLPESTAVLPNQSNCGDTQKSLDEAFTLSCNTTFANVAMSLGEKKIADQAAAFGFGAGLGSDINSAASTYPSGLSSAQLAMSGIGQFDVAATPLQMAMVAGAIANDGVVMEPYVVSQVRTTNESVVSKHSPTKMSQAMDANNAKALQQMMGHVVTQGTGTAAQTQGLTIAGKTGTAETSAGGVSHSWFVGYSPENHVAVTIFLADPQGAVAAGLTPHIMGAVG